MIEHLPSPGDPAPVVSVKHGEHLVTWTVHDQWVCTCSEKRRLGDAVCPHVTAVAQQLPRYVPEALVAARRRNGYLPPGPAKPARKRTT